MCDCMRFPDTVEEFMEQYKVVDKEGIYMSKGAELVPIFRMEQWFAHGKAQLSQEGTTKGTTTDTISRQEAMDALAKIVPYAIFDESTESYTNGLTDAYNLICQLPSAQPYTAEEIQKMQELESAQVEKAYKLGRESAQPTATWLIHKWGDDAKCSNCGRSFKDVYDMDNYDQHCRHCGTHMKGIRAI